MRAPPFPPCPGLFPAAVLQSWQKAQAREGKEGWTAYCNFLMYTGYR